MKNNKTLSSLSLAMLINLSLGLISLPVTASSAPVAEQAEPEKGPHRGRMLRDGDFALELSIFETDFVFGSPKKANLSIQSR